MQLGLLANFLLVFYYNISDFNMRCKIHVVILIRIPCVLGSLCNAEYCFISSCQVEPAAALVTGFTPLFLFQHFMSSFSLHLYSLYVGGDCCEAFTSRTEFEPWLEFDSHTFFDFNKFSDSDCWPSFNSKCLSFTTAWCLTEFLFVSKSCALVGVKVAPFSRSKSAAEGSSGAENIWNCFLEKSLKGILAQF